MAVSVTMTDSQQVLLSIAPKDKKGNPAPVDGVPDWLVDLPTVVTLQPSADGMSCLARAVGPLGAAIVSAKADADLGAGVTPLVAEFDFTITGGTATVLDGTAGTPEEQP